MNIANVELYRLGEVSPMVSKTYQEEVRGFQKIEWAPQHIIFHMKDETLIAYKADRVHELTTMIEET
jgi:hypothetical protein